MNILIITPDYPDKDRSVYPFVKQLVDEFASQGNRCYVVAPYSITKNKRRYEEEENVGENITIYRPNHLSFSTYRIGKVSPSQYLRQRAINRTLRRLSLKPDMVYCHFWECALEGYAYAKENHIPLFVASGESNISTLLKNKTIPSGLKDYVSGVICVSTKNKEKSISLGLTTEEKCFVKPNAVNNELFRKLDKVTCRKKLGLPLDAFIISFVGSFVERKGANRVAAAIKSLSGAPVYSIFAGRGNVEPDCENILFKGTLHHEEIPEYLNASDVFVLPTLAEGCCNAIVEAMACGVPIISSNRPFNWDVLNDSNSIMIDPENVQEIANAIKELRDDPEKRIALSGGALETAKNLTIEERADSILNFIKERIQKN